MDSSLSGERSNQEKQKKRVSCKHRGFTFLAKETEIGNKKKGGVLKYLRFSKILFHGQKRKKIFTDTPIFDD